MAISVKQSRSIGQAERRKRGKKIEGNWGEDSSKSLSLVEIAIYTRTTSG